MGYSGPTVGLYVSVVPPGFCTRCGAPAADSEMVS